MASKANIANVNGPGDAQEMLRITVDSLVDSQDVIQIAKVHQLHGSTSSWSQPLETSGASHAENAAVSPTHMGVISGDPWCRCGCSGNAHPSWGPGARRSSLPTSVIRSETHQGYDMLSPTVMCLPMW